MERPSARLGVALLALLLATAAAPVSATGPAAVGPSPGRPADTSPTNVTANGSRVLLLDGASRSGFAEPTFELSSAVAMDHDDFESALTRYTIQERFLVAESMDSRRRILADILDRVSQRAATLRERERTAREATLAGDKSVDAYVETAGRLHARAVNLAEVVDTVKEFATRVQPSGGLGERIRGVRGELAPLQGSVRDHVARRIAGQAGQFRLHAWLAETGVAVSELRGGRYLRTVYRGDNFDAATAPTSIDEALSLRSARYPWLSSHSVNFRMLQLDDVGYRFTFRYGNDRVVAHVDSSTGQVYVEERQVSTFTLSTGQPVTNTSGNVTLAVTPTYPGGPLRVAATANGTPLDGTVRVNGTAVGETDGGVLWALSPGGTFPVSVTTDRGTVRLEVTARPAD